MVFTSLDQINETFYDKLIFPYEDFGCVENEVCSIFNGNNINLSLIPDYNKGRIYNALSEFYGVIKRDKAKSYGYLHKGANINCPLCLNTLVQIAFRDNDYEYAKTFLNKLIMINPNDPMTCLQLAIVILAAEIKEAEDLP